MVDALMQARLDHLNARGLELRMSDTIRVVLGEMVTLRGDLVQDGARTVVERAAATRAEVATLHLQFGGTVIASEAGIVFDELRGTFHHDPAGDLRCDLLADRADGVRLQLAFGLPTGQLVISGRAVLTGARLQINDETGAVFADKLALTDVVLELAGTKVDIESLDGTHVAIEWSSAGVRVRASSATLGAASAAAAELATRAATATPTDPAAEQQPAETSTSLLPPALQALLPLLDGLAGQLDVDLGLDLTVPVLGRRRATHKFRIPIEAGALDYRKLENDLSTLEDQLLDFSMRDETLVLEMGIPFIPTRGKGKPILRWDVQGGDLDLARENRIRLAMLPQFEMASEDNGNGSSGKSRVSLRELSLQNLSASLRLDHAAPPSSLPLRRIGELALRGDAHHAVETQPRDGNANARIADVELGPMNIAIGAMTLGFQAATLASADVDTALAGMRPRSIGAQLRGLQFTNLDLAPRDRE